MRGSSERQWHRFLKKTATNRTLMDNIFQAEYFDNSILDYSIALGIIIVGFTIVRLLKRTILKRFQALADNTLSTGDNFIVESIDKFGLPALYYFIVYAGVHYLDL